MTLSDAQQLGRLLAAGRARAGLSTTQLAAATEVNQSSIVRLEQGQFVRPSPTLLQRLAQVLDLPLNDLYRLADVPLPSLRPYLRASYGLTESDAARAQAYIEKLAANYGATGQGPAGGADEAPLDN
jgi:transcriptional regulator with XRE-family HTH domain